MRLVEGPVTPVLISELIAKAGKNPDSGALSLFLGQVRKDQADGKFVKAIEYSAFEEMVIMEANKINKTILSEFDDLNTFEIIHSRGLVKAGEISMLIMVSAGHRLHAIKACSKAVELISEKLPILKKELYEDASENLKQNE